MDLREVIIPGGGQNDIWHPLHFKGKYAGEIRVELTYYDTRPKDESVLEQRRERERSQTSSGGSLANVGGPRQLAPREVKRRPLPQGPLGSSPATRPPLPDHVHSSPIPPLHPGPSYDGQPRDIWAPDQHYHSGIEQPVSNYDRLYIDGHGDQRPLTDEYSHDAPRGFSNIQDPNIFLPGHEDFETTETRYEPSEHSYHSDLNAFPSSPATHSSYYTPDHGDRRHSAQPAFPPQDFLEHSPSSPYPSSPPIRSSPGMVHSAPGSGDHGQRAQFNRYSTSPVKAEIYRDSPLRQSISHHEIEPDREVRPRSPDDRPPPPPPAHGQSLPSSRSPSSTHQDASDFQIPRKLQVSSPENFSPEARSPLQTIERNFDPYHQPSVSPPAHPSAKQDAYKAYPKPEYVPYQPPPRSNTFPRPSSNRENNPPMFAGGFDGLSTDAEDPSSYDITSSQPGRNGPPLPPAQPRGLFNNGRPTQAHKFPDVSDRQRTFQSQPPIVRPRAISPGARNAPPRKSVSPHPPSPLDDRRLSGVPFGPGSYDVLNPITSPVAANTSSPKVENPGLLKEAARQREVEKLREQGPIIGNDGREIDPSDHLPSDTWAPEPERKIRKPEVVIRFRTKDEAVRTPIRLDSSPASARPLSMSTPAQTSSPCSVDSPSCGAKMGRNRLQKQMPSRPLPVQPFQHPHSSPAVPMAAPLSEFNIPSPGFRMPPANDFNTYSSGSRAPMRPALSEYSVLSNRSYGSSSHNHGYEPSPPPIPAKVPFYSSGTPPYSAHGNMDPFAAEISSIDIGGSGGRRGGARPRRVFEV